VPVYFLDVDFPRLQDKAPYHYHKYVHAYDVPRRDLGRLRVTRARYLFADPLRHFVPRRYVPFLGAPDLVDDFYYGPAHSGRAFTYEVSACYRLYEVTGREVRPKFVGGPASVPVQLVEELPGFTVYRVGAGYHAIPRTDGPFDLDRLINRGYGTHFHGPSSEDVRRQVRAWQASRARR
jgi:hypothetical protein